MGFGEAASFKCVTSVRSGVGHARPAEQSRCCRAHRTHAFASLRRRVLASFGTRSRLAAALARSAPRLPPPGGARRDSGWQPLSGFSGEQFALPEAVGHLREVRRRQDNGALLSISGADPLSLSGILTPGPKLPALTGSRAVYRDGLPIALLSGGREQYFEAVDEFESWAVRKALLKGPAPARLAELA